MDVDDDLPIDNDVTSAALPLSVTYGEVTPAPGKIEANWVLPANPPSPRRHVRAYVRPVSGFRLGALNLLPPDATSHTFEGLPPDEYYVYVGIQNAAGVGHIERSGPHIVT